MTALKFSGPVLPDGEARDLYVVDGRVTYEKQAGAETAASGWIVPGLVDAHCHVGLDKDGAVDVETTERQLLTDREAGALLLRDCGSPADTSWVHEREDLPRLIRAGRHLARTRRYLRNFAHEIEPEDLAAYVKQEAARGDGWVKLIGDWIDREEGDLTPSFPKEATVAAVEAAHRAGAKITVHCFGEAVLPHVIEAGVDCIEHGTGLSLDLIQDLVTQGIALVPTVKGLERFPVYAEQARPKFPDYAERMTALFERRRDTIMSAYEAGVDIYAGTDAGGVLPHGGIVEEILALADYGMSAADALGAASWRARQWLGLDGELGEGSPADFLVYDRNPLTDLGTLRQPARIVLRGTVIR